MDLNKKTVFLILMPLIILLYGVLYYRFKTLSPLARLVIVALAFVLQIGIAVSNMFLR